MLRQLWKPTATLASKGDRERLLDPPPGKLHVHATGKAPGELQCNYTSRGGALEAAAPTWVGQSGGPSRDGRQRCHPGGSVGRAFRPKICFAALRAAGRSIGGTESETPSTDFVSRSLETQSLLSTSLRRGKCRMTRSCLQSRKTEHAAQPDAQRRRTVMFHPR